MRRRRRRRLGFHFNGDEEKGGGGSAGIEAGGGGGLRSKTWHVRDHTPRMCAEAVEEDRAGEKSRRRRSRGGDSSRKSKASTPLLRNSTSPSTHGGIK